MGARGPDSQFKPEYCNTARRVAMLGATNDDLAGVLGVCRRTVGNWLQEFPEFKAAIEEGKLSADAHVAEKLYQRATGYERPAVRFFANPEGPPQRIDYTHHHAPDTAAAIFWLRNRRRGDWREQVEHHHTTSEEMLTVLEAARLRARPGEKDAKPH
jgi:hypothetical protein